MTLIEHKTRRIWAKYFYPTEENKNEEFFKTMNKHFEELKEIDRKRDLKVKEIEEVVESFNFNMGDPEPQKEADWEETLEEVTIDGAKLKFNKNNNMPSKYDWFHQYDYEDLIQTKVDEEMEKKDWYVKAEQCDEGWNVLKVDEKFDQSKLKWDGVCMKYGEKTLDDEGGTKPNSDVQTNIQFDYQGDGWSSYFSHSWY